MTRVGRFLPLFLLLFGMTAQARTPPPIHFTAAASPSPVHPGEVATVTVRATVDPGWHVYSVVPTPNGPAATEIVSANGWTPAGPTTEDAPIRKVDPNFNEEVGYHENAAVFQRQFQVPSTPSLITGERFTIHYQTCNASVCLPPTDATVIITAQVTPGPVRPEYAAPPAPNPGGAGESHPVPPLLGTGGLLSTSAGTGRQPGLPLFLLAAVGAGLLAILTPCVFPLIPITLTSFVKQADGDRGKLVRLSTGYALGIVILFVVLGAVVSATLGATGANQLAANPWVNLVEFAIFVIFALSFFETISLRLPANLSALQAAGRKHGGLVGLVLLGVTFVLASFTCTAPFVGTLLVAAAGGEKFRPLLGTLVFALAFVSPFLLFALFPQWIGRIPKSGLWLARAKATLGFIELAAALKFLSNADQVWQWKILTQPVLLAAWALIFVCAALYLFGILRFGLVAETETDDQRQHIPLARRTFAGVFLLLALYCFWGLAGRPLSPIVGAFLPPAGYGGAGSMASDGLPWLTDYSAALAQAKSENKPLLIDFTGYTCTNCRFNEKNVFPHLIVQNELAKYVRVQLYTDGGKDGPANQHFQESKFGDVTLPLYGVVDPNTETVVAKTGGLQSVDGFTRFLQGPLVSNSPNTGGARVANPTPPLLGAGGLPEGPLWSPYSPDAVAQAATQSKPSIVDFTATWCINCKEIEHDVFASPTVAPTLGRDFVTLRADLTQWNAPASVALEKQYGFASLPTIIFLDKSGQEIRSLRITGRLGVADFQKRMQQASDAPPAASVASR